VPTKASLEKGSHAKVNSRDLGTKRMDKQSEQNGRKMGFLAVIHAWERQAVLAML
jgi:hypothetical protein